MSSSSSNIFGESKSAAQQQQEQQQQPQANVQELELAGVIGFNGHVPHGLVLHPNDQ